MILDLDRPKNLCGFFDLSGSVLSPYHPDSRAVRITDMAKARVVGFQGSGNPGVNILVWDNSNNLVGLYQETGAIGTNDLTSDQIKAAIYSSTVTALQADSGFTFASSDYSFIEPVLNNRSISYPSLAVNTARQASTVQDAMVVASVDINTSLSLTGGSAGKVTLQYADNNTFTTNLVSIAEYTNSNTGTLTIGLALAQVGTAVLTGYIPYGKYYRLLTTNVTGTPTYGTPMVQEVLL